jgi:predicted MFS family arabinose efflux permease
VEDELALTHGGYAVFVFAVPLILAAGLEAAFALLTHGRARARLLVAAQAVLAGALLATAYTRSAWGLTVGLALAGTASGVACGAAQALLVVGGTPAEAERAMVRWTLFGAVGDVIAPLVTAGVLALGFSYRAAMAAVGLGVALQCAASARLLRRGAPRDDASEDAPDSEAPAPLRAALATAARRPSLWLWLFAAAACTLLDEVIVAFAALRLERVQASSASLATATAVTFSAGTVLGAALTDRAVARWSSRGVLLGSAGACALALLSFLAADGAATAATALFVVGVTCAPHHALAQSRAYAEMPNAPGTVQAIGQLFVALDVALPLAIGVVADMAGLGVAILCLCAQPVVIAASTLLAGRQVEGPPTSRHE